MKKYISLVMSAILLITICFSSLGVYAADDIECTPDVAAKKIDISGTFENGVKNLRFVVQVFNPNKTPNELTNENHDEYIHYVLQGVLNDAGGFEDVIYLSDTPASGFYKVIAKSETGEEINGQFYYATDTFADEIAAKIKAPVGDTQDAKINNILTTLGTPENRLALNAEFSYYDELSNKTAVATQLYNTAFDGTRNGFIPLFDGIVAARIISEQTTGGRVGEILNYYSDKIGISGLSVYQYYNQLTDKSDIEGKLVSEEMHTLTSLKDKLATHTIKYAIDNMNRWDECRSILNMFNDTLNIDFSAFDGLGNKEYAVELFLNDEKNSAAEIVDAWTDAVKKAASEDTDESHSPSRGGGGFRVPKDTSASNPVNISIQSNSIPSQDNSSEAFNDIGGYDWAKNAIETLALKKIISGYTDGTFKPGQSITREESIKLLMCLFGLASSGIEEDFVDVGKDRWSYSYIMVAKDSNIISGTGNNLFEPAKEISRQDMMTIIYRAIKYMNLVKETNTSVDYTDIGEVDSYAIEAVNYLTSIGVVNGFDDNSVKPHKTCSRAEIAVIIYRLMQFYGI